MNKNIRYVAIQLSVRIFTDYSGLCHSKLHCFILKLASDVPQLCKLQILLLIS